MDRDIPEQMRVEERFQQTEERMRAIMDSGRDAIGKVLNHILPNIPKLCSATASARSVRKRCMRNWRNLKMKMPERSRT